MTFSIPGLGAAFHSIRFRSLFPYSFICLSFFLLWWVTVLCGFACFCAFPSSLSVTPNVRCGTFDFFFWNVPVSFPSFFFFFCHRDPTPPLASLNALANAAGLFRFIQSKVVSSTTPEKPIRVKNWSFFFFLPTVCWLLPLAFSESWFLSRSCNRRLCFAGMSPLFSFFFPPPVSKTWLIRSFGKIFLQFFPQRPFFV